MRTTINEPVDRRGGADSRDDNDTNLKNALKILADASAFLELKIEEFKKAETNENDAKHTDSVKDLVQKLHAAWRQVIDIEVKTGRAIMAPAIDLEAARAEVESCLDRYAA